MGVALGASLLVFLFSPKTIGTALGAGNLDLQTPVLWIMASSAGVFCAWHSWRAGSLPCGATPWHGT